MVGIPSQLLFDGSPNMLERLLRVGAPIAQPLINGVDGGYLLGNDESSHGGL
jgi:hypothetical protein